MWTVPRREGAEERCDRLLALYDEQIADLEASRPSPYWDGYCGLVAVCDEELVRPDSSQNTAQAARLVEQQQREAQQRQQQRSRRHARNASASGSGPAAAAGPAAGASSAVAYAGGGSPGGGVHTPPSASPRSSPGSSPFKPAPGLEAGGKQNAALMAEQAALLLQRQGRLREAQSLLHSALRACPTTDTQLAGRIIDLLLEAEREAQETPSHSRAGSEGDRSLEEQLADAAGSAGTAGLAGASASTAGSMPAAGSGSAAVGEVAPLLRAGITALAAGEERRALSTLQAAAAACPPELVELRRRVELYAELVACKRRA